MQGNITTFIVFTSLIQIMSHRTRLRRAYFTNIWSTGKIQMKIITAVTVARIASWESIHLI